MIEQYIYAFLGGMQRLKKLSINVVEKQKFRVSSTNVVCPTKSNY